MSRFRDVVARMAIDAEFARHARAHPDEVGRQYGLDTHQVARLRELSDAEAGVGPEVLGARLSKSGFGTGGLASMLSGDLAVDLAGESVDPADRSAEVDLGGPDSQPARG